MKPTVQSSAIRHRTRTGADLITEVLVRHGIERLFLYPGGTIAPILESWTGLDRPLFCARHEQGAGYAALAVARLTRRAQIALATSGPGVTNLVTCVADAFFDSTPMVFLTGQVGTADLAGDRPIRQRGFQEVDTPALMRPITKAVFQPRSVEDLIPALENAFRIAQTGRPGPVVVDLPMNVQRAAVPGGIGLDSKRPAAAHPENLLGSAPDADRTEQLAQLLAASERPVLLAGQGVLLSDASEELRRLADTCKIPVVTSLLGLGAFPTGHPLSMRFLGHTGAYYANLAVHHSDLLIAVGSRLDVRQTGSKTDAFVPEGKVARIDIDAGEIAHARVQVDLSIQADCKDGLRELNRVMQGRAWTPHDKWLTQCAAWKDEYEFLYDIGRGLLHPQSVIETASRCLGDQECIVATGVGSHQQWVARHFEFDYPKRRWLTSGGHGAMGYDLPAAIGAQLANPTSRVLCFVGDGSVQMNIQELATAVEHAVPIKIIVLDNDRLGIVSQFQKLNWKDDPTTGNKWNPDFAAIARAYGLQAMTLNAGDPLPETIARFLQLTGPALLHCRVYPGEDVVPMLLADQRMNQMWPY